MIKSAYSAYDRLNKAGIDGKLLSNETVAKIGAAAIGEAEFSYDSKSNTLMASFRIGSTRLSKEVSIDVMQRVSDDE